MLVDELNNLKEVYRLAGCDFDCETIDNINKLIKDSKETIEKLKEAFNLLLNAAIILEARGAHKGFLKKIDNFIDTINLT